MGLEEPGRVEIVHLRYKEMFQCRSWWEQKTNSTVSGPLLLEPFVAVVNESEIKQVHVSFSCGGIVAMVGLNALKGLLQP